MDEDDERCGRCGGPYSHKLENCPAKDYFCQLCKKIGHYLEFCKSPPPEPLQSQTLSSQKSCSSNDKKPRSSSGGGGCKCCGKKHAYGNCEAKNSKCNKCEKFGHFTHLCINLKLSNMAISNSERRLQNTKNEIGGRGKADSSAMVPDKWINKRNYSLSTIDGHDSPLKSKCKKCNTSHKFVNCPAKNSICSICKKMGHFEEYCIFKNAAENNIKKDYCGQCGGSSHVDGSFLCPAKNVYCNNCHFQGHFTQCCHQPTPEKIEDWKTEEYNAICRYIFSTIKKEYNRNVCGIMLEKRKMEAMEIREKQIDKTLKELSKARNLELCFVMNASASMKPHIEEIKKYINDIIDKIIQPQANMSQYGWADSVRLAMVAYQDYGNSFQYEIFNFDSSVKKFKIFCENLKSLNNKNSKDPCEDVLLVDGFKKALLELNWNENFGTTKIIFYITNENSADGFINDSEFFSQYILEKRIQYFFGKISNSTDKMIQVFSSDAYEKNINSFENIFEFILSAISKSIVSTIISVAAATATTTKMSSFSSNNSTANENERNYKIDKIEPKNWKNISEITASFLNYKLMDSMDDIIDREFTLPMPFKYHQIKLAPNPFGKGGNRLAYYGMIINKNTKNGIVKNVVFKEYLSLNKENNISINYKIPNEISTISSYFAQKFNKKIQQNLFFGDDENETTQISFLKIKTVRIREKIDETNNDGKKNEKIRYMCVENRFHDEDVFYKFTNNATFFMTEENAKMNEIDLNLIKMLLAFSHFTYQESNGYLMIVDLQGIINDNNINKDGATTTIMATKKFVLTDPSIHCKNVLRFGKTNFGEKGMQNFFNQHRCNSYCKKLGLTIPSLPLK